MWTSSRDQSRQPSMEPATEASVRATRQARSSSMDSGSMRGRRSGRGEHAVAAIDGGDERGRGADRAAVEREEGRSVLGHATDGSRAGLCEVPGSGVQAGLGVEFLEAVDEALDAIVVGQQAAWRRGRRRRRCRG